MWINGPGKFHLSVAVFDDQEKNFTLEGHGEFRTKILSAKVNGRWDKRNEWILHGIMYNHHEQGMDFEMEYNCATRKGKATFMVDGFLELCEMLVHEQLPHSWGIPYDA